MDSFSVAPQQNMQEVSPKNYVFVDEHNRHKRLRVSRACENCRKQETRCDAAKTNTWPCFRCIKLQIDCVQPNGSESKTNGTTPMSPSDEYQQTSMQQQQISNPSPGTGYATGPAYSDAGVAPGRAVPYESSQQPGSISYGAALPPDSMMEQPYASENVFPKPMTQREFFTRCTRTLEEEVKAWSKPGLEKQFSALRKALFEDVQELFVQKSTCPSGSHSSSPRASEPFRPVVRRSGSVDQHLGTSEAPRVSYTSHLITPPIFAGPVDSKSDCPVLRPLVLMSQGTQVPGMLQGISFPGQSGWGPAGISGQWDTTLGTPNHSQATATPPQTSSLNVSSTDATEVSPIQDIHAVQASLATGSQKLSPPHYSTTPALNSVSPTMWHESVTSVYEGGVEKHHWDYDSPVLKLH